MNKQMGVDNALPERIKQYLNERGLSDNTLARNHISWDGERIVIPIFDQDGVWQFNKYRRDPAIEEGPKYTYDRGSTSALYGCDKARYATRVIICEGEFDSLVLEDRGFIAVSSTGGAGSFKPEWFDLFYPDTEFFVCFDNDLAGNEGRVRLTKMKSTIKSIPLPNDIGSHGDVTDFFVRLGKTSKDFEILMKVAQPLVLPEEPKEAPRKRRSKADGDKLRAAKEVPLDQFLKFNRAGFAKCPFHEEKTPSFHWIKKTNKWHCFGGCGSGDGIDLVMRLQNMTMPEAIDHLARL